MAKEQKEVAVQVNIVTLIHFVLKNVQKVHLVAEQEMAMHQTEAIVKERTIFAWRMEVVKVYIIISQMSMKLVTNII